MLVAGQQCQHLPDAEWEAASIKGRCRTFPNDGDWALADALAPAGIGQKRPLGIYAFKVYQADGRQLMRLRWRPIATVFSLQPRSTGYSP